MHRNREACDRIGFREAAPRRVNLARELEALREVLMRIGQLAASGREDLVRPPFGLVQIPQAELGPREGIHRVERLTALRPQSGEATVQCEPERHRRRRVFPGALPEEAEVDQGAIV